MPTDIAEALRAVGDPRATPIARALKRIGLTTCELLADYRGGGFQTRGALPSALLSRLMAQVNSVDSSIDPDDSSALTLTTLLVRNAVALGSATPEALGGGTVPTVTQTHKEAEAQEKAANAKYAKEKYDNLQKAFLINVSPDDRMDGDQLKKLKAGLDAGHLPREVMQLKSVKALHAHGSEQRTTLADGETQIVRNEYEADLRRNGHVLSQIRRRGYGLLAAGFRERSAPTADSGYVYGQVKLKTADGGVRTVTYDVTPDAIFKCACRNKRASAMETIDWWRHFPGGIGRINKMRSHVKRDFNTLEGMM